MSLLDRKFEKFQGGPLNRGAADIRVTINRRGMIYLNAKAHKVIGQPKAVALYYSREDDVIALQPAYERFAENFKVVKKQQGFTVHASPFCRHYKIRVPATERFLRPDIDHEGNLLLNLRETVSVGGMTRARR